MSAQTIANATAGPWQCERCGGGDNATRFHNPWDVAVGGECGDEDAPEIGEEGDYVTHEIELCDRCARKADTPTWCLVHALRVQLAFRRSGSETPDEIRLAELLKSEPFGKSGAM